MRDIIEVKDNMNNTIQRLYQLELLNKDEVKIVYTTSTYHSLQSLLLTRLVAEKIQTSGKEGFTRLTTFMESHWALKHLFQYWKSSCKRHKTCGQNLYGNFK